MWTAASGRHLPRVSAQAATVTELQEADRRSSHSHASFSSSDGTHGTASSQPGANAGRGNREQAGQDSTSGAKLSAKEVAAQQIVSDKLISVFASKNLKEWRKLIAHSSQWPTLAPNVFARMQQRLQDPTEKMSMTELRRLHRRLREVHEETTAYRETLQFFEAADALTWEGLVAVKRKDLTTGFFEFLTSLVDAAHKDKARQEELKRVGTQLIALAQAFDAVEQDSSQLELAELKFKDLLTVGSLEEMDTKLDTMAAQGQLDAALMLTLAKAHNSVKDTDYTREEVKDVMAHLYFKAKETAARQQPKEVRIMKHLLSMEDPQQRRASLTEAFTPGPEVEVGGQDLLSTTPARLLMVVDAILAAYEAQHASGSMLQEAAALMKPEIITRLKELQLQIRQEFT